MSAESRVGPDTRLLVVERHHTKEPAMRVRIQVIKVCDIEVDADRCSAAPTAQSSD